MYHNNRKEGAQGWIGSDITGEGRTSYQRREVPAGKLHEFSSEKVDYDDDKDYGADGSQHDHHLAVLPPVFPFEFASTAFELGSPCL